MKFLKVDLMSLWTKKLSPSKATTYFKVVTIKAFSRINKRR